MNRFYCRNPQIKESTITITERQHLHHIKNVLRLKAQEEVVIFDDRGNEYRVSLTQILPDKAIGRIKEKSSVRQIAKTRITIACAIPKKSRLDDIIDKLTQLGVDEIIPLVSERVIVRIDKSKAKVREKRWQKIALSASQQSQRNTLPSVAPVENFQEVLEHCADFDLKLIPTLTAKGKSLKEIAASVKAKNILVLIGPEGDFSPREVSLAVKAGFLAVSLGDRVLRVETAAVYLASILNYETQ